MELDAYNGASGRGHNMGPDPGEITQLLHQWPTGDRQVEDRLFELLTPEMHQIAERCFRRERPGNSLQPTVLVNEAFLRLAKSKDLDWHDRGHFLAISARVMRRYLIDHARARPDILFLPMEGLPERFLGTHTPSELVIAIDELLEDLERESPSRRTLVELKFFLGSTDQEIADALGITLHTMQREWYRARRWLFERLTGKP
jgi:RNA polymerase sigma factor (TIGR02999 family)